MCGIAGVRRMGERPILPYEIETLLASLEYRGNHAAGVALQAEDGTVSVWKDMGAPWSLIHRDSFKKFIKENIEHAIIALCHTRKATKGWPSKNENNHPLFAGKAAVVHNGVVTNDDYLFKDMKMDRHAETDSDVIRAIIDAEGLTKKVIPRLNRMCGTVAAAAIHPEFPGELLLLRSGNPLVVACGSDEKIYWASDRRAIFRATKPWVQRYGVLMQVPNSSLAFINMYEDSAWMFGPKGFKWHEAFKSQGNFQRGYHTYHVHDGTYGSRQAEWRNKVAQEEASKQGPPANAGTETDELMPRLVYCPNTKCLNERGERMLLELDPDFRGVPLYKLQCIHCKTNLAGAEHKAAH